MYRYLVIFEKPPQVTAPMFPISQAVLPLVQTKLRRKSLFTKR
jgi:hypothetical protein